MGVKRDESAKASGSTEYFRDPGLKHPSVERAQDIDYDLPYERLRFLINKDAKAKPPLGTVAHWFRFKDLRLEDNKSLSAASKVSRDKGSQLVTFMVIQPSELDFHGVGDVRKAFMVENIKTIQQQLFELNIPLVLIVSKSRKDTARRVHEFAKSNNISDIYANYEYEHDELFRDIGVAEKLYPDSIRFRLFHDQTVVEPGAITNGKGEPMKVFTPFWHAWTATIAKNPDKYYLTLEQLPAKQEPIESIPGGDISVDDLDDTLSINRKGTEQILKLWPVGHRGALQKLDYFLENNIGIYGERRSTPAEDCGSRLSPYLALGIISSRETMARAREKANNGKNFGTSTKGPDSWIRELAFREHYRQMVACVMPHIVMNMPSSLKLANIQNEEDAVAWERWCEGKTGMPFVDAGMRQLNAEGYMHNRCRMNVASYLRMNLLIDFRMGLRYFANKLIDWDCCNNAFGWDPTYTVFNPVIQGEKCDPEGKFIRKWVPELKSVEGKALFDPFNRLPRAKFEKLDYPAPMIGQQEGKDRAYERFKQSSAKKVKKEEQE